MEVVRLTEDNISDFSQFIPQDIAENISRFYYRGIVATDGTAPRAGMIWMLKNTKKQDEIESHILWLESSDEESADVIFEEYDKMADYEEVVRTSFSLPAGNARYKKVLLKKKGFSVKLMEGDTIVARLSEIGEIDFLKKLKISDDIMPLRSITYRGFARAVARMAQSGFYGLCEDLELITRLHFENDVSCYYQQENMVNGMFLCHRTASGKLLVEMMAAIGQDYVKILPQLIGGAYRKASEIYPPETEVLINRHNYASLALGEKLFPRTFGIPVYIGSREEQGR